MTQDDTYRPQPLKTLDGTPVFEEEWQAQVLAMVDALITNKSITSVSWSETFGAGLKHAHVEGRADDLDTYYAVALETLEMLMAEQCEVSKAELTKKQDAWTQAYLSTPHGQPVKLRASKAG